MSKVTKSTPESFQGKFEIKLADQLETLREKLKDLPDAPPSPPEYKIVADTTLGVKGVLNDDGTSANDGTHPDDDEMTFLEMFSDSIAESTSSARVTTNELRNLYIPSNHCLDLHPQDGKKRPSPNWEEEIKERVNRFISGHRFHSDPSYKFIKISVGNGEHSFQGRAILKELVRGFLREFLYTERWIFQFVEVREAVFHIEVRLRNEH